MDRKRLPPDGGRRSLLVNNRRKSKQLETSVGFHKDLFKAFVVVGMLLGLLLNVLAFGGGEVVTEWARFLFRWSLMLSVLMLFCSSLRTSLLCEKGKVVKDLFCAKIRDVMLGFLGGIFLASVLYYVAKHIGMFLLRALVG